MYSQAGAARRKRYAEDVDGMTLYYIEKKGSRRYRKCVLPTSVQSVRSLLLGLDEGSVGTPGVAVAAFHLKKTRWIKPRKYTGLSEVSSWQEGIVATKFSRKASCGQRTSLGSTTGHSTAVRSII